MKIKIFICLREKKTPCQKSKCRLATCTRGLYQSNLESQVLYISPSPVVDLCCILQSLPLSLSLPRPDMEISQVVEDKEHETVDELTQKVYAGAPHEAFFLVLAYLPLFELLAMSEVCVSLRDAVHKDVLPWLNIIVERPLNLRLSDEILMNITSKAIGRLKTLALMDCTKITDDGLQWVIDKNPHINKVSISGLYSLFLL